MYLVFFDVLVLFCVLFFRSAISRMIQCVSCAYDDVDIPAPLLLEYLGEDSSLWSEIRNLMEHEIIVLRQSVEEEE